jgi:hypothetical protein
MVSMKRLNALTVLLIAMVIVLVVRDGAAQNTDMYVISIPIRYLGMSHTDRITKYKMVVQAGFITGLMKIPHGWKITIDDNLSHNPTVNGIASHGVAYMTLDNVTNGAFDSFLIIQKDQYVAGAGVPLDISINLTISSMAKPVSREVIIKMNDLVVSPYPR